MKKRSDGRYQKRITLPNGKSKLLYSSANTEREAIKDFNKQMLQLKEEKEHSMLFENVAKEWREQYLEKHSEINFRKNLRASVERTINYFTGIYVQDIAAAEADAFLLWLKECGYGYKTVASHKSALNMIMKHALLQKYIQYNPVKDVLVPPNLPRQKRQFPTDEDLQIVTSHYEGFDFLPYFLLHTGLRSSEALAIDVEKDIDFERKTITVNKHLIHDGNKPIIEPVTKTADSERTVILLDRVAEKIQKKKGLLFCNDDGTPYTFKNLVNNWYAYRKKYNTTVTAHQLRHGYATMLFEAGVNEKDAQELMGHTDITLTRQIYTHIRNKHKEETAKKLNEFNF